MVKLRNPIVILRELDRHQWLMFFAGFLGWTWDAFDFFTVSLNVTDIAKDFNTSKANVSWVSSSITSPSFLTLELTCYRE
jgi:SHS family lactate transporter-like MFS transporter